ncbi:hypothetical protein Pint_02107 [Pistacia integerrima]|uniref:Uncharacterized protein n=1 Tax=Pistacia integerrima TaxID=434235 RepID=A0ACC0ZIV5_9ROSI|nr:hypothetical protein Pint_02107 [Pistacia integerrima]
MHDEECENRAKKLEEEVRSMMNNENAELLSVLELIDDIQRLGLGYRFQKDIKRALDRINMCWEEYEDDAQEENKLSSTALRFRLLRQHGYDISQGEKLLDEARTFSRTHLTQLKRDTDSTISDLVTHALELPLHHRMQRLEAWWYIEAYSKKINANYSLLEFAQLDFNRVQAIYKTDLNDMSRWWKEIDLANKLSFARDRLMECFFWTVGMFQIHNLVIAVFTDAVERWDIDCVNQLPDYMKLCFLALDNSVNEMGYDTLKKRVNIIPSLAKAWGDMCKAFLEEAKWSYNKHTPTFEEYLDNAWRSASGALILVHSYFLLNQGITNEALDSLEKDHNLLRWSSVIFRLCNDLSTSKAEIERGETASSILCYMQETGLPEEVAREDRRKLIEKT